MLNPRYMEPVIEMKLLNIQTLASLLTVQLRKYHTLEGDVLDDVDDAVEALESAWATHRVRPA